jgi:organic hydroperoxide reductase OsmC/OhrA
MHDFPHHYRVTASSTHRDDGVTLEAAGLPAVRSASPAEFDGPGDRWSPETLLVGAVADCFILTFKAVARASNLPWQALRCEVNGTLDRVDRATQFTRFDLRAELRLPGDVSHDLARRVLEKSERACLISNSLKAPVHLQAEILTNDANRAAEALAGG